MKKNFLILLCFFTLVASQACDICGCGVGSYYFGIMPQFNKNFIGLRYRNMQFESHLNSRLLRTNEYFRTTELWGRFYINPKVQIMTFLPYSSNTQTDINNTSKNLQGINDIVLMANYNLLNLSMKNDTTMRTFKHSLWLGGGLKLPTGKYDFDEQDTGQVANPNFQLGSGSVDFLLTAFYNVRYKNWGFNQDLSYKINTKNGKDYRFGNRVSGNSNVFYIHQFSKKFAIMPYGGLYYEHSGKDHRAGQQILETGGHLIASNLGVDMYAFKRLNFGLNYQIPIRQNLGNGEIGAKNRLNVQVSVLF
jgi:hypothetical protein